VFYEIVIANAHDLAHGFHHAIKADDIGWIEIWGILESLSDMENEIKEALNEKKYRKGSSNGSYFFRKLPTINGDVGRVAREKIKGG
jgi:hypothetical protein